MKKNICKFIEESERERLVPRTFVCERNPEAMRNPRKCTVNRMVLIKNGELDAYIDERNCTVRLGDIIFLFAGECARFEPHGECEYMYIDFGGSRCGELFRRFGIGAERRIFPSCEGLIAFWQDALLRSEQANIDLVSESVLLYSFAHLYTVKASVGGVCEAVLSIIEEEFSESELSLAVIAQRLGYNPKYLSHSFKKKMGMGVSEYITTVRIKHAVFLLEHGIESVKNVSYLCGFSDPLYFSAVFKKTLGVAPSVYVRRQKSDVEKAD